MRRAAAVLVASALLCGSGCVRTVDGTATRPGVPGAADHSSEADKLDPYGFGGGQCGPLDDATIVQGVKAKDIHQSFFGALCYWVAIDDGGGLIDLLYAYYEAGDVGRDRVAADGMGQQTADIVVSGRQGFTSTGPSSGSACGVTVPAGTGSLSWWVQYRKGGADACAAARGLVLRIVQSVL